MRKIAFAILMMSAVLTPALWASDSIRNSPSYRLTSVNWVGSFQCEEKLHEMGHKKDHDCDLRFVNSETGEVWNVRDNPTLSALHQKYGGAVKARIAASSSPRFLLGGSFVEIKQIQVLR